MTRAETRWDEEEPCFRDVAQHLALLYATMPSSAPLQPQLQPQQQEQPQQPPQPQQAMLAAGRHAATHVLQHSIFPACQLALDAPRSFADEHTIVELACLQNLYKIFERC